jgi:hypothetical protein
MQAEAPVRVERPTFQEAAVRVQDPTAPEYSYARTDKGFQVFLNDEFRGLATPGTVPFRSIERTLAGGQPLPPAPPPAPAPAPKREPDGRLVLDEVQITAPAPAAPAPAAAAAPPDLSKMTDEELRRMAGVQ